MSEQTTIGQAALTARAAAPHPITAAGWTLIYLGEVDVSGIVSELLDRLKGGYA